VKIQAIKQKNLPELNDDFAKELGEFTSSRPGPQTDSREHAKPSASTTPSAKPKTNWSPNW
jgi:hypothetical protein